MPNEPAWISADQVIEINHWIVGNTGEPHAVLSLPLLKSAIGRARNLFLCDPEADIADMAAALLLGIARNHAFEQGNKRTGFTAAQLFMDHNGYRLEAPDVVAFADRTIATMADRDLDPDLADLIRTFSAAKDL